MMRRFTITTPDDTAEAVQFSNGLISALWRESGPYLWISLAGLREDFPDAELTWIDQPKEQT